MRRTLLSKLSNQRRSGRGNPRGSVLVEAALVMSLIFVPMVLSVSVIGLNLIQAAQANQVNRDVGHMFARGVDLSKSTNGLVNRAIITSSVMAPQLASSSTTGVLILSHIIFVADIADCKTCPFTCSGCTSANHAVFERQIVLGYKALKASAFGTIPAASMDTTTGIVTDLYKVPVFADSLLPYLALGIDDLSPKDGYVSETYFTSALTIAGFPGPAGTYSRAFF